MFLNFILGKGDRDLQLGTPSNGRKRKGGHQHGDIKLQDSSTGVSVDIVVKGTSIKQTNIFFLEIYSG